jgi:hypothetical protein
MSSLTLCSMMMLTLSCVLRVSDRRIPARPGDKEGRVMSRMDIEDWDETLGCFRRSSLGRTLEFLQRFPRLEPPALRTPSWTGKSVSTLLNMLKEFTAPEVTCQKIS